MGCPFWGETKNLPKNYLTKRDRKGYGVKNVNFLGEVLNRCSLTFLNSMTLQRCMFHSKHGPSRRHFGTLLNWYTYSLKRALVMFSLLCAKTREVKLEEFL